MKYLEITRKSCDRNDLKVGGSIFRGLFVTCRPSTGIKTGRLPLTLRSQVSSLRFHITVLLVFLLSYASFCINAFSYIPEIIEALYAVANPGVTLTVKQEAIVFKYNKNINLMRLNGDIPESVYQANQTLFENVNNQFSVDAAKQNGLNLTVQQKKPSAKRKPGTDTDNILSKGKDGKNITAEQVQNTRETYNKKVKKWLDKRGAGDKGYVDYASKTDTDFMVNPNDVDAPEVFEAISKKINKQGGTAYTSTDAANAEAKIRSGKDASLNEANSYVKEMQDQSKHKFDDAKANDKAYREAKKNNPKPRTKAYNELQMAKGNSHLERAQGAKYIERIQEMSNKVGKQYDVKATKLDSPGFEAVKSASGNRGPGTSRQSAAVGAIDKHLTQRAIQNYAETLVKIAEKNKNNPNIVAQCQKSIAEVTKDFSPSQKGEFREFIDQMTGKDGGDFAKRLADEYKKSSGRPKGGSESRAAVEKTMANRGKGPQKPQGGYSEKPPVKGKAFGSSKVPGPSLSTTLAKTLAKLNPDNLLVKVGLTDANPGAAGKVIGGAGLALVGLQVYDIGKEAYETGDYWTAGKKGAWVAGQTYVYGKGVGLIATASPATMSVVGAGMVAYQGTREIMSRIKVDGKTLDQHTQEKIDDEFYQSSQHDMNAEAALQQIYMNALKSGNYQLPPGMTVGDGWRQIKENMNKGGKTKLFDGVLVKAPPIEPELDPDEKAKIEHDRKQAAWKAAVLSGQLTSDQYDEFERGYDPRTGRYIPAPEEDEEKLKDQVEKELEEMKKQEENKDKTEVAKDEEEKDKGIDEEKSEDIDVKKLKDQVEKEIKKMKKEEENKGKKKVVKDEKEKDKDKGKKKVTKDEKKEEEDKGKKKVAKDAMVKLKPAVAVIGSASQVQPLEISVDQDSKIHFFVNDLPIKPGETIELKLKSGGKLVIRAYAMGKYRKSCLEKQLTRHATLIARTPYRFEFRVVLTGFTGETRWKVKNEKYSWSQPSSTEKPTIYSKKATNDVIEWIVPEVRKSRSGEHDSQIFSFSVSAIVKWDYTRVTNKGVKVHDDTKQDECDGALSITVHR